MREKKISGKDKQSHHSKNFLVVFGVSGVDTLRGLVNASNKTQALRIGLSRYCRAYPDREITRARVCGEYPAGTKRIEKRIG